MYSRAFKTVLSSVDSTLFALTFVWVGVWGCGLRVCVCGGGVGVGAGVCGCEECVNLKNGFHLVETWCLHSYA